MEPPTKRTLNWGPYLLLWIQPLFMTITSLHYGSILWICAVPIAVMLIILLFLRNRRVSMILGCLEYVILSFGITILIPALFVQIINDQVGGAPGKLLVVCVSWVVLASINCFLIFSPQGSQRNPVREALSPPAPIFLPTQQPMTYSPQPTYPGCAPHFASPSWGTFVPNQPPPAYYQAHEPQPPQFVSEKK